MSEHNEKAGDLIERRLIWKDHVAAIKKAYQQGWLDHKNGIRNACHCGHNHADHRFEIDHDECQKCDCDWYKPLPTSL